MNGGTRGIAGRAFRLVTPTGILRLAVLTALCPLAGLFGRFHWTLDLLNHFQAQYFVMLLLATLALTLWRKPRQAIIAFALLLIPAARLAPLYFPAGHNGAAPALRVAAFNVLGQNPRHADAVRWIRDTNPDFIYLPETGEFWGRGLAPLNASHPHRIEAYFQGNFGSSFHSKHPIVRHEIHHFGNMGIPMIEATVATPLGEVTVFGAHPVPPVTAFWAAERDIYLSGLAGLAAKAPGRTVILGDLNATRWSHSLAPLFHLGFRDTAEGHGYSATWMRENPLVAVPIDFVLTKGFTATINRETGPFLGSDHRPVTADLAW